MSRGLSARRRIRRGGLTTLSLSSPESNLPPPGLSPDPEITEANIWLGRLAAAHDGLKIVHLTDIHRNVTLDTSMFSFTTPPGADIVNAAPGR